LAYPPVASRLIPIHSISWVRNTSMALSTVPMRCRWF